MPEVKQPNEAHIPHTAGIAQPGDMVDSTADNRTVNNVMRHEYKVLTDTEKEQMRLIKDQGMLFYNLLHSIGVSDPASNQLASRELSIAATKIEEAVMWAVKHITK